MPIRKTNSEYLIPLSLSKKILTVGTQHKNHRGGVGAVIDIYSKNLENFQFIKSHKPGSKLIRTLVFLKSIFEVVLKLSFNPNIKIVHIHGASYGSFFRKYTIFSIAKYIFRKKVVYHIHGGAFHQFYTESRPIVQKHIKKLANEADCLICLSQKWKDIFLSIFEPKEIIVIPNIIDYPTQVKSSKNSKLNLLFLGLITQQKGIYDLLDVLIENKQNYSNKIKLHIGGNGEVEHLNKIIEQNQLSEIVRFLGWISNTEKAQQLQDTDIYILPSYQEGLPISILEAMSYQHPIIATSVGGIPEIVEPDINGKLIEAGNKNHIKSAIDFFLENPDKIKEYGSNSGKMVQNHLPGSVMNELTKTYKNLLNHE